MIVDDTQILNSEEKLINSKMNACFFDHTHIDLIKNSQVGKEGTFVWEIYHKKIDPANMCFLFGIKNFANFNKRLIILPSLFSFTLRFLASLREQDIFAFMQRPWLSANLGFYLSKRASKTLRKAIDDLWAVPLLEQGYLIKMLDLCAFQMSNDFPIKSTIFTSTKQFTDAHTIMNDLQFDEFKAFFYLHILLISLFFTVQAIVLLTKSALKLYLL